MKVIKIYPISIRVIKLEKPIYNEDIKIYLTLDRIIIIENYK